VKTLSAHERAISDLEKMAGTMPPEIQRAQSVLLQMSQVFSRTVLHAGLNLIRRRKPAVQSLVEAKPVGLVTVDETGTICSFNGPAERIFGYSATQAIGTHVKTMLGSIGSDWLAAAGNANSGGAGANVSLTRKIDARRRNRTIFPAEITLDHVHFGGQRLAVLVVRDTASQDYAEAERRRAEARFRSLVEQIPAVTFMGTVEDGPIEFYVSPQIEGLLGFTQDEWLGDPFLWYHQLHPDDRELCNREFARGCEAGGPFRADFRALNRNGDVVWIHGEAHMVRDEDGRPICIQGVAYDVTEPKRTEEATRAYAEHVKASLAEKEVMLKEIHHRVKNNLQVISSLLNLQSAYVEDPAALQMFTESRDRIHSMALIHEQLYQSANLAKVDFKEYVESLTALVFHSYSHRGESIALRTLIDNVSLSIDLAVCLGLIISELVSNCLKYAFPHGRTGEISVVLREDRDPKTYRLTVADNGVGMPRDFNFRTASTLGMQLVNMLSGQIGGSIKIDSRTGTEFALTFRI
jgi:PAS domain S-box-containing protein